MAEEEVKKEKKAKKEKKEKKAKKIKVKIPLSPKQIAFIMAFICLVSFLYKFTIGITSLSTVLVIAAVPTLFLFICKFLYAKNMHQTDEQKRKSYFIMMIATASLSTMFILFSTLKVGGINIEHENKLSGWIGTVFILFIIAMFVLSVINLKGALKKDDLVVIGIKEISFVAALADGVMIYGFLYRVLLKYLEEYLDRILFISSINKYLPLGIALLMTIVPLLMLRRYIRFRKQMKAATLLKQAEEAEAKEAPVEEEPVPAPAPKTEIPVKFVISTPEGYYISKGKRANSMNDARVFDDYRYAAGIAKAKNGKVVMLSIAPRPVRKAPAPAPVAKEA